MEPSAAKSGNSCHRASIREICGVLIRCIEAHTTRNQFARFAGLELKLDRSFRAIGSDNTDVGQGCPLLRSNSRMTQL